MQSLKFWGRKPEYLGRSFPLPPPPAPPKLDWILYVIVTPVRENEPGNRLCDSITITQLFSSHILTSMVLNIFPGSHDVSAPRITTTSLLAWLGTCLYVPWVKTREVKRREVKRGGGWRDEGGEETREVKRREVKRREVKRWGRWRDEGGEEMREVKRWERWREDYLNLSEILSF